MNKIIRIVFILLAIVIYSSPANAQKRNKPGKYPSLLWEITGNGMKKPSYLFGTMHVSNKLAFHLSDSFYVALNNVEVVAIETKPEIWQQKLFENDDAELLKNMYGLKNIFSSFAGDYLKKGSLAFGKYEKGIEVALAMEPAMVNNLLYRNYDYNTDFEEDTYLDMYIYQIGCKLKKQTTGVEDYEETERLVDEAYEDMFKEKNKKRRNYEIADYKNGGMNLNDAYRNGDLDMLDSINRMNSTSDAFDEKFLYKRNEIQANSIDSIIKKRPLFVGVGAAHLPGERGVIEMLRKKGYTLRHIKMGERDGKQKEMIENIRVPVVFNQQVAADSFFRVDAPGKLYKADNSMISRSQYADMSNGSYYVVTRLKTNGLMWGQSAEKTLKKVDSLLYENIPGKIIKKESIIKNGYRGYNIVNRTRKGDMQRYNIFVTPFEIIFFKISGTGDYIAKGDEANRFFNSIVLQDNKNTSWKKYEAPKGGFSVDLPQMPVVSKEDNATPSRWQFDAYDNADGSNYLVMKTDVHNMGVAGEDTFDLNLMDESFASSDFIERQMSSRHFIHKGYPALDCSYKHKDSSVSKVRFIIHGPHYYSLVAHGKKENENFNKFVNSFSITPYQYGPSVQHTDSIMSFTVKSPVFPNKKSDIKTMLKKMLRRLGGGYRSGAEELEEGLEELKNFGTMNLADDSTGERIFILFVKSPKYNYEKDSSFFTSSIFKLSGQDDSSMIYRSKKDYTLSNGTRVMEISVSDSGSSRLINSKFFTKEGILLGAATVTDTLTKPSSLLSDVFASLMLSDSVNSISPYTKKTAIFFADYFSGDSVLRKRTIKAMDDLFVDVSDVPMIKRAISELKWGDKDYLETKANWISKLGEIDDKNVTDYLVKLYKDVTDTTSLQNSILAVLLQQQTQHSYNAFKDIFLTDPPAPTLTDNDSYDYYDRGSRYGRSYRTGSYDGSYFGNLYDSLKLTKTIFKDMLPLINVDDYKTQMLNLLAKMVDSGYVSAKDYEPYSNKIYLEAKNELKKQQSTEKAASLQKAIKEVEEKDNTGSDYDSKDKDYGNDELILYARLLMPYWDKNPGVPVYFEQMLKSKDKRLKYDAAMLLLKSGKNLPDSMLTYYAAMDDYRYELYSDLKEMEQLEKFPAKYKDLLIFAKAMLIDRSSYNNTADTLVYLDKYKIDYKENKGWLYFFKYKEKKDDIKWKIATVGLMPGSIDSFFVKREKKITKYSYNLSNTNDFDFTEMLSNGGAKYRDFTKFTDVVISDDEPLEKQLQKQFKEIQYSLHKSAAEFYGEDYDWFRNNMLGLGNKFKYGD